MTMKRLYIKPTSKAIEIGAAGNFLLILSTTQEEKAGNQALTNESRGSWDDIWESL